MPQSLILEHHLRDSASQHPRIEALPSRPLLETRSCVRTHPDRAPGRLGTFATSPTVMCGVRKERTARRSNDKGQHRIHSLVGASFYVLCDYTLVLGSKSGRELMRSRALLGRRRGPRHSSGRAFVALQDVTTPLTQRLTNLALPSHATSTQVKSGTQRLDTSWSRLAMAVLVQEPDHHRCNEPPFIHF